MQQSPKSPSGPEPTPIALVGNKVYEPSETDLFVGWQESQRFAVKEPTFRWKKAKLSFELWEQIVCFLRWSQRKFNSETLVTLFYNTIEDRWAAEVFPQETAGMTVKSLENHPLYAELRRKYGRDWVQAGSVHHHCNTSAFQSGTDSKDEENRDGVHITVGKVTDDLVDIHIRVSFNGALYATSIANWIETPSWLEAIPEYYALDENEEFLRPDYVDFPDDWRTRIFRPHETGSSEQKKLPNHHQGKANTFRKHGGNPQRVLGPLESEIDGASLVGPGSTTKPGIDPTVLTICGEIASDLGVDFKDIHYYISLTEEQIKNEEDPQELHLAQYIRGRFLHANMSPLYVEAMLDRIV